MNIKDDQVIDKICDEFEAQLQAGANPQINDYLPRVEDRLRHQLAEQLIRAEVDDRLLKNSPVSPQDYAIYGERFVDVVQNLLMEGKDQSETQSHVQESNMNRDSREIFVDGELQYKLLEEIGQGAFGVVWIAEQRRPFRRKVALKMLNRLVSSRDKDSEAHKTTVARFHNEQQAQALMDHPNIAKILDGGTTDDGHPFLTMELVLGDTGRPINIREYCDREALGTKQRLELFLDVCSAVQHAHQKAIIHRDLKPANILIMMPDDKPVVKVVDFGIAKSLGGPLTDLTLHTKATDVVGTLLYMGPEQIASVPRTGASDVDTLSDLYSLGVILYELLVGSTPIERQTFHDRAILEQLRLIETYEPPKPSHRLSSYDQDKQTAIAAKRKIDPVTLEGELGEELDWIVLKALEKDKGRRYQSVAQFAEIIKGHLKGDYCPVRPPSLPYRLRKQFKKHRAVILSTATVIMLLLAGIAGTTVGQFKAIESARIAKQAARIAKQAEEKAREAEGIAKKEKENAIASEITAKTEATNAVAARNLADIRLYRNKLKAAQSLWDRGHNRAAYDVLYSCRWDMRGWEWRYLASRFEKSKNKFFVDLQPFNIWFSNDLTSAAIGGYFGVENLLKIVNLKDGSQRIVERLDDESEIEVTVRKLQQYDFVDQARIVLRKAVFDRKHAYLAYSPDRTTCAVADGRDIRIWHDERWASLEDVEEIQNPDSDSPGAHEAAIMGILFSPDGKLLCSFDAGGKIKIWDIENRSLKNTLMDDRKRYAINCVAFGKDGTRLFAGDSHGRLTKWDVTSAEIQSQGPAHPQAITSIAMHPHLDNVFATGGEDQSVCLWNFGESPSRRKRFVGHLESVEHVAFSQDGRLLGSCSSDGTARIWDVAQALYKDDLSYRDLDSIQHSFWISNYLEKYGTIKETAISQNGKSLALLTSKRDSILCIDLDDPNRETAVEIDAESSSSGIHFRFALSPNGALIAISTRRQIKIYSVEDGKLVRSIHLDEGLSNFAFSNNGEILAVSRNPRVELWSTVEGDSPFLTFQKGSDLSGYHNTAFVFSPNDRLMIGARTAGQGLVVWDIQDKREIFALDSGFDLNAAAFTRGGRQFAAAFSSDDGLQAMIFDTNRFEVVTSVFYLRKSAAGFGFNIRKLGYSDDGCRLFASNGSEILVWDTKTWEQLTSLACPAGVLLSGHPDDRLKWIDVPVKGDVAFQWSREHFGVAMKDIQTPDFVRLELETFDRLRFTDGGNIFVFPKNHNQVAQVLDHSTGLPRSRFLGAVSAVSKNGRFTASIASDGEKVLVRHLDTGKVVREISRDANYIQRVTFAPNEPRIAVSEHEQVRILDFETGQLVAKLPIYHSATDHTCGVLFAPKSSRVVVVNEKHVTVFNIETGEVVRQQPKPTSLRSFAISADGKYFVVRDYNDGITILSANDGTLVGTISNKQYPNTFSKSLALSPDGKFVAMATKQGELFVWHLLSGDLAFRIASTSNAFGVEKIAFSPDSMYIASANIDGSIRLFSRQHQKEITTLRGHASFRRERGLDIDLSSDGKRLASISGDELRIWDFKFLISSENQ